MDCVRCGKELREESRFCDGCGAAQAPAPPMPPRPAVSYATHGFGDYPGIRTARVETARKTSRWKKVLAVSVCTALVALLAAGGAFAYFEIYEPTRELSQARDAFEDGDYGTTIALCEDIAGKWPAKPQAEEAGALRLDAGFLEGERLVGEGGVSNYALADEIFDGLAEEGYPDLEALDGDRFDLYTRWANELKATYGFGEAVGLYNTAETIAPLDASLLYSRVECLYQWGEQLKAVPDFRNAADAFKGCYDQDPMGPFAEPAYINYVDMTVAVVTGAAPPSKQAVAGGQVKVNVQNAGASVKELFVSGPSSSIVTVQPGQTVTVFILPGRYNICALCPGENAQPYIQVDNDMTQTSSAGWYTWKLWDQ